MPGANQCIEALWGILCRLSGQHLIDFSEDFRDDGHFTGDFLDKKRLKFCFFNLVMVHTNQVFCSNYVIAHCIAYKKVKLCNILDVDVTFQNTVRFNMELWDSLTGVWEFRDHPTGMSSLYPLQPPNHS